MIMAGSGRLKHPDEPANRHQPDSRHRCKNRIGRWSEQQSSRWFTPLCQHGRWGELHQIPRLRALCHCRGRPLPALKTPAMVWGLACVGRFASGVVRQNLYVQPSRLNRPRDLRLQKEQSWYADKDRQCFGELKATRSSWGKVLSSAASRGNRVENNNNGRNQGREE